MVARSGSREALSFDWKITKVWVIAAVLAVCHVVLISMGGSEEDFLIDRRVKW
jgi:hypothetical protein